MVPIETRQELTRLLQQLKMGDLNPLNDVAMMIRITGITSELLSDFNWTADDVIVADTILRISNIAYNNSSNEILPLDDGLYDRLVVAFQKHGGIFEPGAVPTPVLDTPQNEIKDARIMCSVVTEEEMGEYMYAYDIYKQAPKNAWKRDVPSILNLDRDPISKRLINTTHKYPELVGTLDKCKFVTNQDAINAGAFDATVNVFERDYIHKCLDLGVIRSDENFTMIGELKYDGVSVEAEIINGVITIALSRGDTADNVATDLTPIFGGYTFPKAAKKFPKDMAIGVKFEAVITQFNLDLLAKARGKSYKNGRNAIIGLLGSSDAYNFVNLITLIPLATSLDIGRLEELKLMNYFFTNGEPNRYCVFEGNYISIMYQVRAFMNSAEVIRKILPYMIDGVVVSFIDQLKIEALGRVNSVNKYQMAIKFVPRQATTIFTGYTYSIGKSGDIIPMAHFKPCEFIGGIHTKQTIHSYERFKQLNLAIGEQINIDYVNDVMTYVTKPDNEYNRNFHGEPEKFIENCPCCGTKIEISESGKSAYCPNKHCHERKLMRMVDMLDRLGFKDFGEETVRALGITSLVSLIAPHTIPNLNALGDITLMKFMDYCLALKTTPINDYKLMSALSFDGMAEEKWKLVLKVFTITELYDAISCNMGDYANEVRLGEMCDQLKRVKGIGDKVLMAVVNGFNYYAAEIAGALGSLNIIDSKGQVDLPKIAFTGFRDAEFGELLGQYGFDASDKNSVTKDTVALIAADPNENSGKIQKAQKYGVPIYTRDQFIQKYGISI